MSKPMNRTPYLIVCLLMSAFTLSGQAGPRDGQWKKVQEAVDQGLPKTAVTNLEPIIQGALRDKAYAEAVKAIGQKIALESNIEGNKPEERISRLASETARAPKEMVPVLDTLLAHWYWNYFQQNRWRFLRRTATTEAPGKDFSTWDLPRLFAEIDRQFQKALAAEKTLKSTPISAWNDLLPKGTMPDACRPTLYDFILHEALSFYTSGEQAGAKPEDAFQPAAESPILDDARKFVAWQPATTDTNAPAIRAIRLYQDWIRFHQNDPAPALALADADLDRLTWGWNVAYGENKNRRYQAALERFIRDYADFEVAALALEREGRLLQEEGDLAAAHQLARRGVQLHPQSPGGKLCQNLVRELESKSVSIATERIWNCGAGIASARADTCPVIEVRYRNVGQVFFRAISCDWEIFLQKRRNRPENLTAQERREILSRAPAFEWSEKLTPTADFKERTQSMPAPRALKPGFYFIAASHRPDFGETENLVSMTHVWVSDLSLITRDREGLLEGFVLEADSGKPIAGAQISVWHLDRGGNRVADPDLTTDENGIFSMKPESGRGYLLRVRYRGQEIASPGDLWNYSERPESSRPTAQTVFFTDRAIYRPGQTIQYKGICLWVDQDKDNYQVLKGEPLTVVFRDSNGKEIARQKQRANDYGSFAGSFIAPRDRVLGQMSLVADGRARGQTEIRIEEYKRPKFEVTLAAPKTAARLNAPVTLAGHATSYTGAAIDHARFNYRIVREVRMPWWWGWWGGHPRAGESQEIAHGSALTETDGSFQIEFPARPDPKVPEKDEPTFVFHIHADVTDSTGETRSADRDIRVGYTALEATLTAEGWQTDAKPVRLQVATKTLDEEPQTAEGSVKIYSLKAPVTVQRPPLEPDHAPRAVRFGGSPESAPAENLSDPNHWPLDQVVAEKGFTTDTNGVADLAFPLAAGAYRAVVETQDRFGKKVTGKLPIQVLRPQDHRLGIKIPFLLEAPKWQAHPGAEFVALWGTGYDSGCAFVEIEHRHKLIARYWTRPGQTQQEIKLAVTDAMRGGFTLHVTQVRENRAALESRDIEVPWDNQTLELSWEHFVSKLQPGQKETWTLVVQKPKATGPDTPSGTRSPERLVAELVATLYDASLDAYAPLSWPQALDVFRSEDSDLHSQFLNGMAEFQPVFGSWSEPRERVDIRYRSFPPDLVANLWGYRFFRGRAKGFAMLGARREVADTELMVNSPAPTEAVPMAAATPPPAAMAKGVPMADLAVQSSVNGPGGGRPNPPRPALQPDLSQVAARKNLNETAFFFPQLTADSNGVVRMTFTMPEALTKWHFLGFAHDRAIRSGFLEGHAVTAKDLMVQPNPPRFLREGDIVEFTVKVSNQSDQAQTGRVRLTFGEALAAPSSQAGTADQLLGNTAPEQTFSLPAKQSRSFAWRITVPDGCGFLTYKAVAAAANVSDGEEGAVPVLARRILVTESLPLPLRGPATRKFEFTRLLKSGESRTLRHQSLTAQMVSNPAWYAVMALPYLMEYPHECSEQVFNRLYANSLARHIARGNPRIRRLFEQWKNTPALDSPLEKNQDLKSVALEETPWLRQAESESQARKHVGVLFDDNRLDYETQRTFEKLKEMQLPDGAWPWFPGGPGNDYITLYVITGFGRLRHLGVDLDATPALRSLDRLDAWMTEAYNRIQQSRDPDQYVPSATDALYLYGRSFFLKDRRIAEPHQKAIAFYLGQARKFWLKTDCRQTQGQLAIALLRFSGLDGGKDATAAAILASLKERSVTNEEMGRFWRDTELSWWWYRAPIETQALMIEAFDEVAHDAQAVEDCKVWLLKQKQTQDWKTTKATADAVYALLLRGTDLLASDAMVELKLGGLDVTPKDNKSKAPKAPTPTAPEPGTGYYEVRFTPSEIKPKLGEITVHKTDPGVAWGSVHWQYLEDMSKVTSYEGTPLKLKKSLFVKTATNRGPVLEPAKGALKVGDELVVRIELRVDRDMEYIHLKDQRGSGTEPVNVLSRYRFQDGLAYYESTRDTASHFFIDYLPKGTYVFEYSTRIQLRGQYQTGVAEIQCLYAPEFNSHSESHVLTVK